MEVLCVCTLGSKLLLKRCNPRFVNIVEVTISDDLLSVGLPDSSAGKGVFVKSWLLALVFLLPVGSIHAAEVFRIEGKVRDPKNSPVAAANVILLQPSSQFRHPARTDHTGSYVISDVPAGDYQLIAQAAAGVAARPVQVKSKNLVIDLKLTSPSAPEAASPMPMENGDPFQELDFNLPAGASTPPGGEAPMQPNPESVTVIRSGTLADRLDFPPMWGQGEGEFRRGDRNNQNRDNSDRRLARSFGASRGPGQEQSGRQPNVMFAAAMGGPGSAPPQGGGGEMGPMGGGGVMMYRMGGARSNRLQGSANFGWNGSALNARPYSLSGEELPKKPYDQERFGASIGGPIPWLGSKTSSQRGRPQFFLNYSLSRGSDLFTAFSRVPSQLERQGDFSRSFFSSGPLAGQPAQIFSPFSRTPFLGNRIPASQINPIAAALLSYVPLPNQEGQQNFFIQKALGSRMQNFNLSFNTSLSSQIRINANYNLSHRTGEAGNRFPLLGGENKNSGQAASLGVTHTIKRGLLEQFNLRFNRNSSNSLNSFAFKSDVEGELGIQGVSRSPVNWGVPSVQFTNFGGLQDLNASVAAYQAINTSYSLNWVRGFHSIRFGASLQRVLNNRIADPNGRGVFTFSGFSTSAFDSSGHALPGTGFDFADFLLGLPQATTVRFGAPDSYLRNWEINGFLQDNWKALPNLTVDFGLRYDLITPAVEKYNRLANLDIAPGLTTVQAVVAEQPGPFSGDLPRSLIFPDKNNFSPRIGIAYKPWTNRTIVVRSGYGVIYNDSIYRQLTAKLVSQPPFSVSQTLLTQQNRVLTLENGFPPDLSHSVRNTLAIDPHYRTGYVQNWMLNVQYPLPARLVGTIGYQGSKGTALDLQRSPNRAQPGSSLNTDDRRRIPNAQEFLYQTSAGASAFHSLNLSLQRRFSGGFSANGNYTFGKSIDNMSSTGGGSGAVAQNDDDLRSERGLSDFDVRHRLLLTSIWQLPFGRGKKFSSAPSWLGRTLGGWTLLPNLQITSGHPFTARVLGNQSNNSGTGALGSTRASLTGQPVSVDHPTTARFFNTTAFQLPPPGLFGDAGRNTIIGPGSVQLNLVLNRTIQVNDRQRLALTLMAPNLTNHPNYRSIGTVVNGATFGQVTSVAPMRQVRFDLRYIF